MEDRQNILDAAEGTSRTEVPIVGKLFGGRYVLREPVGEGGMAVVWRAFDTHLKRDIALKLLHEHVRPVDRQRFGREIRTLAQLSHPGVVAIFDLGEHEGQLYFTMELLEGGPIFTMGPLEDTLEDIEHFLEVAREAAAGLGHVHGRGLVHRDLTPRNVLLGRDGRPRIMDFGLVYVSDATTDLTRTGYTLGTPQYMAPEQAIGGAVGPKSDLYAFGAVLYRTAVGRAPFEADNDQGILYQHVYETPTAPESLNPAIPTAISEAILEFLEKDATNRPDEPRDVLDAALEQYRREHVCAQHRGGRARAGAYPGGPARPDRLRLEWEVSLSGEIAWPAAVTASRDHLVIGTRSGVLSVLERASGVRYADFPARDEITAPATFDGDTLVYASWDGMARAVDWRTGVTRWTHRTRDAINAAPTRWNDSWLIASRDGHLHAVQDGKLSWAYRAGAAIAGSPALWAGRAFVADEDGWVHALNATQGTLEWKVKLGAVHATPLLARHPAQPSDAVLIVPTWPGEVHALRLRVQENGALQPDDEPMWTYDLEGEVWASPAVSGRTLVMASWANELRAVDLESGDDRWVLRLNGRITASPVISRGIVYAASEDGELVAVRLSNGRVIWRDTLQAGLQATPLVMDGSLIVPMLDGRIRCYR
jgi:eukaryotic-like serine/threonine-protein kinase